MEVNEHRSRRWVPRAGVRPQPAFESAILQEIGRELRSTYQDLVSEPLPEHLSCILERLPGYDAWSAPPAGPQGGAPGRA
jgi:hypothetical protein